MVTSAQSNMIEDIRAHEISDPCVLQVLRLCSRRYFVPNPFKNLAFSDASIPINYEQVTPPTKFIAQMLQALTLSPKDTVLEIGTGTGYTAALLAHCTHYVTTLEIIPELAKEASRNLSELGLVNVQVELANGLNGWAKSAPYDVIVLSGSVPLISKDLRTQLQLGGRLFAVVGQTPIMKAMLITRLDTETFHEKCLFETTLPPLVEPSNLSEK